MITTMSGSATSPRPAEGDGVIVAHVCNNRGGYGAGFVVAINETSSAPCAAYRAFYKDSAPNRLPLGSVQFVECNKFLDGSKCDGTYIVANMIAQDGLDKAAKPDGCLVDYVALKTCLTTVFSRAAKLGFEVHMPSKMGAGLAGGDLGKIHAIIKEVHDGLTASPYPSIVLWEFTDTTAKSFVA